MIYGNLVQEKYDEYIIEYAGKESELKKYRECLDEVFNALNNYIERAVAVKNGFIKANKPLLSKPVKKITSADMKKVLIEYQTLYKEIDKLSKEKEVDQGVRAYKKLENYASKFAFKYSDVFMEDKKKLEAKLEEVLKELDDTFGGYLVRFGKDQDTPELDKLNEYYVYCKIVDPVTYDNLIKQSSDIFNFMAQEANYSLGDIRNIRKQLGTYKEDKFMYKFVNKLIKTKEE